MSFLRLATNCAVFDDKGRVLLSKRGDLNVWNLPGGRLDSGELLPAAAAREVVEETGIVAQIERPVGLYYWDGWQRLNILYTGWALGGTLQQLTYETRQNEYFPTTQLPLMWDTALIHDAAMAIRPLPQIVRTEPQELRRIKWALRRRWVANLLRGRPEPRHVRFDIHAVAVIVDSDNGRVLTLPRNRLRMLPRVSCDGRAPWVQLAEALKPALDAPLTLHWVGVWQDVAADQVELVFAAMVRGGEAQGDAQWNTSQNPPLDNRDTAYVQRTSRDLTAPVWTLEAANIPFDRLDN